MKIRRFGIIKSYQLFTQFLLYSNMKKTVSDSYKNNPYVFLRELKKDYNNLILQQLELENCLKLINNQIEFVEKFLNDCGVKINE